MAAGIKLGDVARDSVSGFEGVVVARTEWFYGCVRFALAPRELHDGKMLDEQWFDEARVVPAIKTSAADLAPGLTQPAGGGPNRERRGVREG